MCAPQTGQYLALSGRIICSLLIIHDERLQVIIAKSLPHDIQYVVKSCLKTKPLN